MGRSDETRAIGRSYLLDGLRGFAALSVLIGHMTYAENLGFAEGTYLAVDFFFILSGYVLGSSYEHRLGSEIDTRRFLLMRIVRLYPLYALGLLLGALKAGAKTALHPVADMAPSGFMLALTGNTLLLPVDVGVGSISPINRPGWSLLFEWLINIVYAAVLYRLRSGWLWAITAVSAVILVYGGHSHHHGFDIGYAPSDFGYGLARVTYGFVLGVLIARGARGVRGRKLTAASLAMAPLLLVLFYIPTPPSMLLLRDVFCAMVVSPAVVLAGTRIDVPAWGRRIHGLLGDLSYPLYALHFPILMTTIVIGNLLHLPKASIGIVAFVVPVTVAFLAERYVDKPVRRWLSERLRLRESAPPQVVGESLPREESPKA